MRQNRIFFTHRDYSGWDQGLNCRDEVDILSVRDFQNKLDIYDVTERETLRVNLTFLFNQRVNDIPPSKLRNNEEDLSKTFHNNTTNFWSWKAKLCRHVGKRPSQNSVPCSPKWIQIPFFNLYLSFWNRGYKTSVYEILAQVELITESRIKVSMIEDISRSTE